LAIKKYQEGAPPSEIFRQSGFDIGMIGNEIPQQCLRRWLKTFKQRGEAGLLTDGRGTHKSGGRPKSMKHLTDQEKMERLEAEVAYLKGENSFLAKLRKQRLNYDPAKSIKSSDH
jgi:hypothetical protein